MIERFYTPETGHSPLSNFSAHGIVTFDGREWGTVEHYYQAMKSIDTGEQERIRMTSKPGSAKRMGRRIDPLRPDWEVVKLQVMRHALLLKFTHDNEAGKYLLSTGDEVLMEGNDWGDTFWGVVGDSPSGHGENWLGVLLMARRAELRGT